jgi:hypothetical protein
MKRFGTIAIVLSCLGSSLWAQQLKPEEKRALELKPAVVLVVVQFKTKWSLPGTQLEPIELQHTETGTGFLFRPDGYLITNGHVVADANLKDQQAREARDQQLKVELATALQNGEIAHWLEEKGIKLTDEQKDMLAKSFALWRITIEGNPTLKVILQNGNVLDPEILQYSPPIDQHGKDVAILKIPGSNLPTVKLGNSENVRLQDQIMVMGYPATASPFSNKSTSSLISMESGLEPSATNGHISALKVENTIGTPLLQSDVAIFHGNSGGPAFNDQGEVIGLATYGAQEAQGFNFLVPINTAMEFVRQSGVAPEVGSFNRHWAEALDLYDEGHCNRSTAEFDNVSQFMPGLRDAQKYRALAVDCVDRMKWYEKLMESPSKWPVLAILAIVILGGGLWLLLGRSGAAKPPAKTVAAGVGVVAGVGAGASPGSFGRIQFTSGSLSGRTFPISKEGLWIGRDPKCGVVLQDDSISGQHAWIVPADGNIVVIDKGSTNGTYVNSVDSPRISKVGLRNGDRVFLGHKGSVFTYFVA